MSQRATISMIIPLSKESLTFGINYFNPHDCAGLLHISASNYICFGHSRIIGELNVSQQILCCIWKVKETSASRAHNYIYDLFSLSLVPNVGLLTGFQVSLFSQNQMCVMGSDKAPGKNNILKSDLVVEILGSKSKVETYLYLGVKKTN